MALNSNTPLFSYQRILFNFGTWLDPISVLNICVQCLPGAYDQVTNYLDMVIFFLKKISPIYVNLDSLSHL